MCKTLKGGRLHRNAVEVLGIAAEPIGMREYVRERWCLTCDRMGGEFP